MRRAIFPRDNLTAVALDVKLWAFGFEMLVDQYLNSRKILTIMTRINLCIPVHEQEIFSERIRETQQTRVAQLGTE
jgi:hypothetical protein